MIHIGIFSSRNISGAMPEWGGVHTHLKNTVSLLLNNGYKVSLFSDYKKKIIEESFAIIPLPNWNEGKENKQWLTNAHKSFISLHTRNPVHCIFSEGIAVKGLIQLMNELGVPVVSFMHLLHIHYFYNIWQDVDGPRALKSYLFRSLPIFLSGIFRIDIPFMRQCQKVITGSVQIAQQIQRLYLIPEYKVDVIHNWVEPDQFKHSEISRNDLREQMGIEKDDVVFLLLGALSMKKGFHITLKSYEKIIRIVPNSRLLIAGEGSHRSYFENYVKKSDDLCQRVKLIGLYPHEKLSSLFSATDIFIIPSLMNEVLPYTLLEAMSCEVPIISTDISANRELLGNKGYFVPRRDVNALADAMLYYVSDLPAKRSEAKFHRTRVIEKFSNEMASKKINRMIHEIVR